jgi:lipopolysaccharide/colanic/teichoic acid biosynthesis glycosyltransferase
MKYRSILVWFEHLIGQGSPQLVPGCGEVENNGPNHEVDDDSGGSAKRLKSEGVLERAAKRTFDVIVATLGLIFFSPIILLASLAIKLDTRGPVLCSYVCHGYGGETLRVFKFRSTTVESFDGHNQSSRRSSRVTRVGYILRPSGIDGLPHLINVLRGEMSIVGPRPYARRPGPILQEHISEGLRRSGLKPGLTGWAQVNRCADVSHSFSAVRHRIERDLYYVENWSFLLDMKIILMALSSGKSYTFIKSANDLRTDQ